mgnify:CR=1 FL=1
MNTKALITLEYDKIIKKLETFASSTMGKKLCKDLLPSSDYEEILSAQTETKDALTRLYKTGYLSFQGLSDIRPHLRLLEIDSTLNQKELLEIARLLSITAQAVEYGDTEDEVLAYDSLNSYFGELDPLEFLYQRITQCILSEDEISDDASSALKDIRREIKQTNISIHNKLTSVINSQNNKTMLQDALITVRNGRYCVPVKTEYRNAFPGMIHDQSSSGSTLFIEPMAVVQLNNHLKELDIKEKMEIEKILQSLSAQAASCSRELEENQKILTKLDFIFAKASLALDLNATKPVFNTDHYIQIRKGRHPLLPSKKVVPIDIHLGKDFDLLVITGPNTGGKTVSLKTIGLFTLMGQAGLHIPALDRSELSIFTEVFADIGDEQSIEQSLSTFSSHMTSIVSILQKADADSLCLFDELGAGTDPTEGAALAIAVLNYLHERGIRTVATTHYSELKVYALSTDFVENACCEFNVDTLSPTYRLLIGVPGKSNAFAISKKLGLPDHIIEAATAQIGTQDKSFEDLLSDLEESRITIEKERREIASYKEEIKALREKLQQKNEKIDMAKDRILREANEQAREILQDAKETADETIRIFQKAGPNVSLKTLEKEREKLRGEIGKKNDKLALKTAPTRSGKKVRAEDLKLGDTVKILSMGLVGTVSTLPDHKGNLFVQCGIMRSQANVKDLAYGEAKAEPEKPVLQRSHTGSVKMSKSMHVSAEINLLGKTVDEALAELDKYLDDAYLAHLPSVRVVHGKGTGALRSAVQSHLKRIKYVKSYRLGEYGEGDAGVTIVTFKE